MSHGVNKSFENVDRYYEMGRTSPITEGLRALCRPSLLSALGSRAYM